MKAASRLEKKAALLVKTSAALEKTEAILVATKEREEALLGTVAGLEVDIDGLTRAQAQLKTELESSQTEVGCSNR